MYVCMMLREAWHYCRFMRVSHRYTDTRARSTKNSTQLVAFAIRAVICIFSYFHLANYCLVHTGGHIAYFDIEIY